MLHNISENDKMWHNVLIQLLGAVLFDHGMSAAIIHVMKYQLCITMQDWIYGNNKTFEFSFTKLIMTKLSYQLLIILHNVENK